MSDAVDPGGPVEVLRGGSRRAVRDGALVLQAAGIPHALHADGAGARILVPAPFADAAREELADYAEENRAWPPVQPTPARIDRGIVGAVTYALVVIAMYPVGGYGAFGLDFWSAGRMDAAEVLDGAWWRAATSLTLHVDLQHVAGNLLFGVLFGVLAAHALGSGLAWAMAFGAGFAGNVVNAWMQGPHHRSVGASTGVFALLGILGAYEWARRREHPQPTGRRLAPVFGAAALLGWLGMGDGSGRVDVLAHVLGLGVGAALGVAVGFARLPDRLGRGAQVTLGLATLAALAAAWWRALA